MGFGSKGALSTERKAQKYYYFVAGRHSTKAGLGRLSPEQTRPDTKDYVIGLYHHIFLYLCLFSCEVKHPQPRRPATERHMTETFVVILFCWYCFLFCSVAAAER